MLLEGTVNGGLSGGRGFRYAQLRNAPRPSGRGNPHESFRSVESLRVRGGRGTGKRTTTVSCASNRVEQLHVVPRQFVDLISETGGKSRVKQLSNWRQIRNVTREHPNRLVFLFATRSLCTRCRGYMRHVVDRIAVRFPEMVFCEVRTRDTKEFMRDMRIDRDTVWDCEPRVFLHVNGKYTEPCFLAPSTLEELEFMLEEIAGDHGMFPALFKPALYDDRDKDW